MESMKKRLPWLIVLLFLGMVVSSVVGAFEVVVAVLPIRSYLFSLFDLRYGRKCRNTVTCSNDPCVNGSKIFSYKKDKVALVLKEMKVGFSAMACFCEE